MIESGAHDAKISTIGRIAASLGYPPKIVARTIEETFRRPPDSVAVISERIAEDGEESWKTWLFDFVDAFREKREERFIDAPPDRLLPKKIAALMASTVETLCDELNLPAPWWCGAILPLDRPWFVSGVGNLKTMALAESPVHYRKRNIFVLENFLSRR